MKRIDYLPSWSERRFGVTLPRTLPRPLRGPLLTVTCALAFAVVLHGLETARLRDAQAGGIAIDRALASVAPDAGAVHELEQRVARLRALATAAGRVRRSGTDRAAEIARVTNLLPADAWLTSLRVEPAALTLDGSSTRLATVAAALRALAAHAHGDARLLSVRTDSLRGAVAYAIALDRAP